MWRSPCRREKIHLDMTNKHPDLLRAEAACLLVEQRIRQALVCGIEAHVCVSQTVHDLIQRGLSVHVAVDGVASRKTHDRDVALSRMARAGAILTTSEAAAFELLEDARHPRFKQVQALYK